MGLWYFVLYDDVGGSVFRRAADRQSAVNEEEPGAASRILARWGGTWRWREEVVARSVDAHGGFLLHVRRLYDAVRADSVGCWQDTILHSASPGRACSRLQRRGLSSYFAFSLSLSFPLKSFSFLIPQSDLTLVKLRAIDMHASAHAV